MFEEKDLTDLKSFLALVNKARFDVDIRSNVELTKTYTTVYQLQNKIEEEIKKNNKPKKITKNKVVKNADS